MNKFPTLPPISLTISRTMMSANTRKKMIVKQKIKTMRAAFMNVDNSSTYRNENASGDDEVDSFPDGYAIPPPTEPSGNIMKGMRKDDRAANKRAYAIMEWYRYPIGMVAGAKPRYDTFPNIIAMLRKIALCCQSSVAAERVFSLLKMVSGARYYSKLGDGVETAMFLRVNAMTVC